MRSNSRAAPVSLAQSKIADISSYVQLGTDENSVPAEISAPLMLPRFMASRIVDHAAAAGGRCPSSSVARRDDPSDQPGEPASERHRQWVCTHCLQPGQRDGNSTTQQRALGDVAWAAAVFPSNPSGRRRVTANVSLCRTSASLTRRVLTEPVPWECTAGVTLAPMREPGIGGLRRTLPAPSTPATVLPTSGPCAPAGLRGQIHPAHGVATISRDCARPEEWCRDGDGRPDYPKKSRRPSEMATGGCEESRPRWRQLRPRKATHAALPLRSSS